jgi:hypothetical protein
VIFYWHRNFSGMVLSVLTGFSVQQKQELAPMTAHLCQSLNKHFICINDIVLTDI